MIVSTQTSIQIMLVDDHQTVLWGLQQLINSQRPRMEVVGIASDITEILPRAEQCRPDIILLDMDLKGRSSLDILPELLSTSKARVLLLTGLRDEDKIDAAVLLGARGVVQKEASTDVLLRAIETVYEGQMWLGREMAGRIVEKQQSNNGSSDIDKLKITLLTPKEREIVKTIVAASGAPNKAIAKQLFMSEHTLRNHLTSIYQKLGVSNRVSLYAYAITQKAELESRGPRTG